MAPRKGSKRKKRQIEEVVEAVADRGQHPALATRGRAHAAGALDKLRPGDPDHGKTTAPSAARGFRVEEDKLFQLSARHKPAPMIRVFDQNPDNPKEDIVLFSGDRKQAERIYKGLGKFLKK